MQKKVTVNAAISLTAAILGHGRLEVGTENREQRSFITRRLSMRI